MIFRDLRSFLDALRGEGQLLTISDEVSPEPDREPSPPQETPYGDPPTEIPGEDFPEPGPDESQA